MTMQDTLTGSWIALAGVVVAILAHFNIVIPQSNIETIITGAIALYGVVHQLAVSKQATGSLK